MNIFSLFPSLIYQKKVHKIKLNCENYLDMHDDLKIWIYVQNRNKVSLFYLYLLKKYIYKPNLVRLLLSVTEKWALPQKVWQQTIHISLTCNTGNHTTSSFFWSTIPHFTKGLIWSGHDQITPFVVPKVFYSQKKVGL